MFPSKLMLIQLACCLASRLIAPIPCCYIHATTADVDFTLLLLIGLESCRLIPVILTLFSVGLLPMALKAINMKLRPKVDWEGPAIQAVHQGRDYGQRCQGHLGRPRSALLQCTIR